MRYPLIKNMKILSNFLLYFFRFFNIPIKEFSANTSAISFLRVQMAKRVLTLLDELWFVVYPLLRMEV